MIQGLIAKKAIDIILKKVMEKREVKKLRKYDEEDNAVSYTHLTLATICSV